MGTLVFFCPVARATMSTEVDVDPQTFAASTNGNDSVNCPGCAEQHLLSEIRSWILEPAEPKPIRTQASSQPRGTKR